MELYYTASQDAQAVSTAVDLFHFTVADDVPMFLWSLELAQTTDLGDSQEEVLRIGLYRGVTGGGGGSALTEVPINDRVNSLSSSAATAVVGQGTASTSGTLVKMFYWNIRQAGPVWIATPETAIRIGQGNSAAALRLLAAPSDSITLSGEVMWYEG